MKWIMYLIGLLFLVSVVSAVEIGDACSSKGYNFTVSEWTYDTAYLQIFSQGYDISVIGTARKLNWTSDTFIDGVVYKSGNRTYLSEGGYNGTIPKTTLSNDMQFVVFCTNDSEVTPQAPEFGMIAALVALVSCIWIIIYKKR